MLLIQTLVLSAIAGFTIFLGLPVAKLPLSTRTMNLLTSGTIGILFFLIVEIFHDAFDPIEKVSREIIREGAFFHTDLFVALLVGLSLGLISLPWFNDRYINTNSERRTTATVIAVGIGFHNFSEGLAIGQFAASGALSITFLLLIGFALHNITEGFGIAAPLTDANESLTFLGALGFIAGGPTVIGALLGQLWTSTVASVFCLSLAGGALVYVIYELFQIRRPNLSDTAMFGAITIGLLVAFATDLIVSLGMSA